MLGRALTRAIAACGCMVLGIAVCSATPRPSAQSAWSNAGTRAVEVDTKDADYYVNRGNAFADNKDYDRAIADYNKAIELDPQNAYAYNSRADTLREAGKPAQGLPDAERALQLDFEQCGVLGHPGPDFCGVGATAGGDRGLSTGVGTRSAYDRQSGASEATWASP